jgi:hypothetical protein
LAKAGGICHFIDICHQGRSSARTMDRGGHCFVAPESVVGIEEGFYELKSHMS